MLRNWTEKLRAKLPVNTRGYQEPDDQTSKHACWASWTSNRFLLSFFVVCVRVSFPLIVQFIVVNEKLKNSKNIVAVRYERYKAQKNLQKKNLQKMPNKSLLKRISFGLTSKVWSVNNYIRIALALQKLQETFFSTILVHIIENVLNKESSLQVKRAYFPFLEHNPQVGSSRIFIRSLIIEFW